jgi:hypothetical protein
VNSYPEAAMLEKGSLARLEQICRENQRIGPKDLKTLLSFKRAFTTEVKKLQKPPIVIENHALVAKFANCLTDGFRENIFARLDMIANQGNGLKEALTKLGVTMGPATPQGQVPQALPDPIPRRPEDRYQWKEVIVGHVVLSCPDSSLLLVTCSHHPLYTDGATFFFPQLSSLSPTLRYSFPYRLSSRVLIFICPSSLHD